MKIPQNGRSARPEPPGAAIANTADGTARNPHDYRDRTALPVVTGRSRPACGRRRFPYVEVVCVFCGGRHVHRVGDPDPGDVVRGAGCCGRSYIVRVVAVLPRAAVVAGAA